MDEATGRRQTPPEKNLVCRIRYGIANGELEGDLSFPGPGSELGLFVGPLHAMSAGPRQAMHGPLARDRVVAGKQATAQGRATAMYPKGLMWRTVP
jgi:hypothetical protein